ncbi:hypothetical protein BDV26DRAFT_120958 [Aspergillus bertholletiae]|uniref:Uncharacterized protein n=1 Tax=Aspergillus bertholletiae TaxID=1226010 RepID=A0A5N7AS46_9EURO|nr:hypothetical protein BDV26DRAFT_120958 [Aspergillus bertholletiae]
MSVEVRSGPKGYFVALRWTYTPAMRLDHSSWLSTYPKCRYVSQIQTLKFLRQNNSYPCDHGIHFWGPEATELCSADLSRTQMQSKNSKSWKTAIALLSLLGPLLHKQESVFQNLYEVSLPSICNPDSSPSSDIVLSSYVFLLVWKVYTRSILCRFYWVTP